MGKILKKSLSSPGGLSIWWSGKTAQPSRVSRAHKSQIIWALLFILSFGLAGCGFTPIYKMQGGTVDLASVKITGMAADNVRNALTGRYQLSDNAAYRLSIDTKISRQNRQVDESGLAARIEIGLELRAQLQNLKQATSQSFSLTETQSLARQKSGADQLRDEEIVLQLMGEQLAEQLLLQLSQRLNGKQQ